MYRTGVGSSSASAPRDVSDDEGERPLDPGALISEVTALASTQQQRRLEVEPPTSSPPAALPSPWGTAPFSPSAGSGPSALLTVGEKLRDSDSTRSSAYHSSSSLQHTGGGAGLPLLAEAAEAAIGRSGKRSRKSRRSREERKDRGRDADTSPPPRRRRHSKPSSSLPEPPAPLQPPPLPPPPPPPPTQPLPAPQPLRSVSPTPRLIAPLYPLQYPQPPHSLLPPPLPPMPDVTHARPLLPAGSVFRPTPAMAALIPTSANLLYSPAPPPLPLPPYPVPLSAPPPPLPSVSNGSSRSAAAPAPAASAGGRPKASDKHDLLGKSYNKFNELVFCRHVCGCRPSKYKCDKEGRPDSLVQKLKEEHRARMVRAAKRLNPSLSDADIDREVGSLAWLDRAEILRRASRTMHEQNAALHACGDEGACGPGGEPYPCKGLLKAFHVNGQPGVSASAAALLGASASLLMKKEEGTAGDKLVAAMYQQSLKWAMAAGPAPAEGYEVSVPAMQALQAVHSRGLCVPLLELPVTPIADLPAFVWDTGSAIRFGRMAAVGRRSSPAAGDEEARVERYPPPGADVRHYVLPISASCPSTCVAAGSQSWAEAELSGLMTVTLSGFLQTLPQSHHSTCYAQWSPPPHTGPSDPLRVSPDPQSLVAACDGRRNLFRLLSSLSPAVAAIRPRYTRLAATGLRALSATPLFCSSAHVVLEGRLAWLSVPMAHWPRMELVAHALDRQLEVEERAAHVKREQPRPEPTLLLPYVAQTFVDPALLVSNGVPVYVADQSSPSELVCASGQQLLSAVVLGGESCTLLEVPFLPVEWLTWGPQRCLKWVERLAIAISPSPTPTPAMKAATAAALFHLFPPHLAPSLFPAIVSAIQLQLISANGAEGSSAVDLSSLSATVLSDAARALEQTTAALEALLKRVDTNEADTSSAMRT